MLYVLMKHREIDDDYGEVIAAWDSWRVIRSTDTAPATQWIIQRSRGANTPGFKSRYFLQTRDGLGVYVRECGANEAVLAVVAALPDTCPQRIA